MSFELIVLPAAWVKSPNVDGKKYDVLTKVLNKSYAKVATKFGIITSTRIQHSKDFLDNLLIINGKEAFFFLLLGPVEEFEKLEKTGFVRDFDTPNDSYENSLVCDIPSEFVSKFQLTEDSDVKVTVAEPDFVVTEEIGKRIIATLAFKDFYEKDETIKAYEMTAVTSYVRRLGAPFINYVINNFFAKKVDGTFNYDKRFVIHCDAITEHGLGKFYIDACGFTPSPEPDLLIEVKPDGRLHDSDFEDNLRATQDFHLSFFYREVPKVNV